MTNPEKFDKSEAKTLTKKNRSKRNKAICIQLIVVSLFLVVFFLIGLIFPLRPAVSESEKRELTKFPTFSISALMDGSYFSQLELWYADTFPMREWLMSIDRRFDTLFGLNEEQYIGDLVNGDEIPEVTTEKGGFDWMQLPPVISGDQTTVTPPMTDTPVTPEVTDPVVPETSDGPADEPIKSDPPQTTPKDPEVDEPTVAPEKHGSVYLMGDTAYELYGFQRKTTDRYIKIVNQLADQLDGSAEVYSVIAPLSYGINLDESVQSQMGASNQNDALIYIYSQLDDNVKKVYAYANLMAHKDEYLYYRTDHHWTALGAYYAYEMFCAQKGIAPIPLSSYKTHTYDGFVGSLYDICGSPSAMKNNPDSVIAYQPNGTNLITIHESSGNVLKWNIIRDVSNRLPGTKYTAFIGGDNPYSEIHNTAKTDGSACVVVKNSFGNAYVPFLVDHYEYVYVVDFRYFDSWSKKYNNGQTFGELVADKNIQDVLLVTNIIATGSDSLLNSMENMFNK